MPRRNLTVACRHLCQAFRQPQVLLVQELGGLAQGLEILLVAKVNRERKYIKVKHGLGSLKKEFRRAQGHLSHRLIAL